MLRSFIVLAVVLGSAACSQRLQPGSPEFELEHDTHNFAIAANITEIEEGRLALERSTNQEVRKLAQMVVHDHSNSLYGHLDMAGEFGEEWEIEVYRPNGVPANGQPAPPADIDLTDMDRDELIEHAWAAEVTHNHETAMNALQQLAGAEFDRAYVQRQLRTHREVLKRIDALLPSIISARMRTQLQHDRAMIVAHLKSAERLK